MNIKEKKYNMAIRLRHNRDKTQQDQSIVGSFPQRAEEFSEGREGTTMTMAVGCNHSEKELGDEKKIKG